jgi:hypothetical protein
MYLNMDTEHGVQVLKDWLHIHHDNLPPTMPVDFVLVALEDIMSNNIFQFGDTF